MKYIVVRDNNAMKEHGIVFSDEISHKQVARIHRASEIVVISAGFCELTPVSVWGESETLEGMKSRPEDAEILRKLSASFL